MRLELEAALVAWKKADGAVFDEYKGNIFDALRGQLFIYGHDARPANSKSGYQYRCWVMAPGSNQPVTIPSDVLMSGMIMAYLMVGGRRKAAVS